MSIIGVILFVTMVREMSENRIDTVFQGTHIFSCPSIGPIKTSTVQYLKKDYFDKHKILQH